MSLISNNGLEKEPEMKELREIFDILEDGKRNGYIEKKNNPLIEKFKIKNINLKKVINIESHPKNRYKLKLKNILLQKSY